jgi:GNAT superfamily N-acetyltransferase
MPRPPIRVARFEPADTPAVMAMLRRCSAPTLYRRLHGIPTGVDRTAHAVVHTAGEDTYCARSTDRCVGVASLASSHDGFAHIGVLVEDDWQRRGAGSALVVVLARRAREIRAPGLLADILGDNEFLIPLLARIGPIATSFVAGGYRVRVDLRWGQGIGSRLRGSMPKLGR